jgi:hypothetical protein
MSGLRELTNAELDIVGGGIAYATNPTQSCGSGIKLVEEIIVDILKVLESDNRGCSSGLKRANPA